MLAASGMIQFKRIYAHFGKMFENVANSKKSTQIIQIESEKHNLLFADCTTVHILPSIINCYCLIPVLSVSLLKVLYGPHV